MKTFIKWLGNLSIFIYVLVMMVGNMGLVMLVTELALGMVPILIFNGLMVTLYLLGIFSRFIK